MFTHSLVAQNLFKVLVFKKKKKNFPNVWVKKIIFKKNEWKKLYLKKKNKKKNNINYYYYYYYLLGLEYLTNMNYNPSK